MLNYLTEMTENDIDAVLAVIESQDEDDAEEAEAGFREVGGTLDMFVLHQDPSDKNSQIIGVTGYATPPGCENTHWLSWTYVHDENTNQGHGRKMLIELIAHLKEKDGRMLFVKVSDYVDEEDGAIYAAALHLYQSLGFKIELTHADYYAEGESQIILGLRISDAPSMTMPEFIETEKVAVQFNSVFEIAETDDAYTFGWHDEGKQLFSQEDVKIGINNVKQKEGRAIFLSFPSNYYGVADTLYSVGFKNSGTLHDYYEDGIHDQHFSYKL